MGTCSFDLVRHEFPILKRVAIKSMKTISDVSFYMIEDVFVFDHYKDELYVIASNQFSKASNAELKLRVKHRIQALSQIKVYQENNKMVPKRSEIKANISDKQFIDIVTQMKQRITEGDMFQVVPLEYIATNIISEKIKPIELSLYQNLKRKNLVHICIT